MDSAGVSEGCADGELVEAVDAEAKTEEVAEEVGQAELEAETESLPVPEEDGLVVGVGSTVGGPVGGAEGLAVAEGDMLSLSVGWAVVDTGALRVLVPVAETDRDAVVERVVVTETLGDLDVVGERLVVVEALCERLVGPLRLGVAVVLTVVDAEEDTEAVAD